MDEDSYNNFLKGSALDLCSCDPPKMLFTWAAICHLMVMALADVMVEHLITGSEVEGSECRIGGFISTTFCMCINIEHRLSDT